jgi:37-kD nucleoid-associated bacterial protein
MINPSFQITSVMIHDIPRGNDDTAELILTDEPIQLDAQLRNYFQSKIAESLRKRGIAVIFDSVKDPTVYNSVGEILRDANGLILQSQLIAQRLNVIQTGVNPPGLLVVIFGVDDGKPAVAILKLEREEGIRFQVHEVNGHRTVDLQFLRDLTLTNKTKVFKTSLFVWEDPSDPTRIRGLVSDDQRGQVEGRGVADFYLNTFLGCRLMVNPAQATLEFVKAAEEFFNKSITNPEKKGRYQIALLSEMQNQQLDVTPEVFADDNLDAADRSDFLNQIQLHNLAPGAAFEKDTSLVKVAGFKMTFENGMVLVGSTDDLKDRVHIRGEHEEPGVNVRDRLKELRGR